MIFTTPFLQDYVTLRIILDAFYRVIFLMAVYAVGHGKRSFALTALLGLPMILSLWAQYIYVSDFIIVGGRVCGIVFFAFAIYHIARFVIHSQQVTREVIYAAIVVYSYSFVTITTLGYGDITHLTEKAKAMAILEAFIGQMYLVVVLAWLVGMHVSRKSK